MNKIVRVPEKILFSDASAFAAAGFTYEKCSKIVHHMWTDDEKIQSSTWRELKTILIIMESLGCFLCGKLVKFYTDNQNVVRIASKGSMCQDLHQLDMRTRQIIRYRATATLRRPQKKQYSATQ